MAAALMLLLACLLLPGGAELVENASHLVIHGDLAHDQAQTNHRPFNPEHGCGGGFHLCSCCHSQASSASAYPRVKKPTTFPVTGFGLRIASLSTGFPQASKEPPRA